MKLSRTTTNKIHFIFDELLPPFLRDSKVLMFVPIFIAFRRQADLVMNFKSKAPFITEKDFEAAYKQIEWYMNERETDLNHACVHKIEENILGKTVLDVGCGRGFLANKLSKKYRVSAADILISKKLKARYPEVKFYKGAVEKLPFQNASFDTVICTHTLEHVKEIKPAIAELRRVTKKRLIIVVPKQRPYKYTFDLHLHFFPYIHAFLQAIKSKKGSKCEEINSDLFYIEDNKSTI